MPAMLKVHAWNNMTVFLQQFWVRGFVLPRLLLQLPTAGGRMEAATWNEHETPRPIPLHS
jgi:hypothetical protein